MTEISVRELKSKLSEVLHRAEAGEEIAVTRRGKRIVVIRADAENGSKPKTLEEKLLDLRARGIIAWNGKKFVPPKKGIPLRGDGLSASEMIIQDRR